MARELEQSNYYAHKLNREYLHPNDRATFERERRDAFRAYDAARAEMAMIQVRASRRARRHVRHPPRTTSLANRPIGEYVDWAERENEYWTEARKRRWHRDNPEGETPPWNA